MDFVRLYHYLASLAYITALLRSLGTMLHLMKKTPKAYDDNMGTGDSI